MIKFLKRIPWKDILVTVLVVALAAGALLGVGTALTNKTKKVSPLVFERGALDENGLHVESKTSIYTKDLIECQGLEIEPDFEVSGTYQVFYYDTNKQFLGASALMDSQTDGVYNKGREYPLAKYCRIVISPTASVDEDGYVDEDWKIRFYEITSYANKYTIKVAKDQKIDYIGIDLLSGITIIENRSNQTFNDYNDKHYAHEGYACTDAVYVTDFSHLKLKLVAPAGCRIQVVFYDQNGLNVSPDETYDANALTSEVSVENIIDIPSGTAFVAFNFNPVDIGFNGYHVYIAK